MALLMLITSVGLAVDMHYCGGKLKTTSFFGKARVCHQVKRAKTSNSEECPIHFQSREQGCAVDKANCCQNKLLYLQLDQDQNLQLEGPAVSKPLLQFVAAFAQAFFNLDIKPVRQAVFYAAYRPPLIFRDIPVLTQSFLL